MQTEKSNIQQATINETVTSINDKMTIAELASIQSLSFSKKEETGF